MTGEEGASKDVEPFLVKWARDISNPLSILLIFSESILRCCDGTDSIEFILLFYVYCLGNIIGVKCSSACLPFSTCLEYPWCLRTTLMSASLLKNVLRKLC